MPGGRPLLMLPDPISQGDNMHIARQVVDALLLVAVLFWARPCFSQIQFLEQNWNDATRQLFYTTSQGSRLIPYDWALALEVSDETALFIKTRVPQLGYLPNDNTIANPDRLPVGFVVDTDAFG